MRDSVLLTGCTPDTLMGYLKGLGAFHLVAEQADPDARGCWRSGVFVLESRYTRENLPQFFLRDYRPTPIVTPWNSASGFAPTKESNKAPKDKAARNAIALLRARTAARFGEFRQTIERILAIPRPTDADPRGKERYLARCRASLSDAVVPWLDACFALTAADGAGRSADSFPFTFVPFPLLGTGGNDGVTDFGSLYMQRLLDALPADGPVPEDSTAAHWLLESLFGDRQDADSGQAMPRLLQDTVGQFNPGGVGGANGVQGSFEAASRVNPWDFVLMIEGALLFAGSVTRRLGANATARAVFPFSVESVAVGYGSATASEETTDASRSEVWLPLWEESSGLPEVRQVFAEGRAQVGRRQARNTVEFALAACLLGVSRGIAAFARFGFLKRNGLAFLATPLGRVAVTLRPEARLLNDPPLTDWLDRLRAACRDKDKAPSRYQSALRTIDRAVYDFATRAQTDPTADRRALRDVLRALGCAERTLASGLAFCKDKHLHPLQGLSPQWLDRANDGSPEFRLAGALASILAVSDTDVGPFRVHLEPVKVSRGGWTEWDGGSTSAVWSNRPLDGNLTAAFRRRQLEAFRAGVAGVPVSSPRPARLADVLAFLDGETDDEKLHDLLWGLIAVSWPEGRVDPEPAVQPAVPCEFGLPRLLVEPLEIAAVRGRWQLGDGEATTPDPDVFHTLVSGQDDAVARCVERAARRLKSGGRLAVGHRNRRRAGMSLAVVSPIPPTRLLAACLFPLSHADLQTIANAVLYPPETQE